MYEVFNWGHINESRPKRLSLFVGASEINIGEPPSSDKTNLILKGENHSEQQKKRITENNKTYFFIFFCINILFVFSNL